MVQKKVPGTSGPSTGDTGLTRRHLLKTGALSLAGILLAGAYGFLLEPSRLELKRTKVFLPGLPPPLSGFRLGQLTDLHLGPYVPATRVKRAVELLLSAEPHLVLLTGDYFCRFGPGMPTGALEGLRAPQGCFAVLGNHDYWHGADRVTSYLQDTGITVLVNRAVPLQAAGHPLWLVGLDDWWEGRPDLPGALAEIPPEDFRILMVHEPDFAEKIGHQRVDLQVSGHSHGGQVKLPLLGPPILPRMGRIYPEGLARCGDTWIYTSRGVGLIPPPVRLGCPPEVTVLELHPAD